MACDSENAPNVDGLNEHSFGVDLEVPEEREGRPSAILSTRTLEPLFPETLDMRDWSRIALTFDKVGHVVRKGSSLTGGSQTLKLLQGVSGHCNPGEVLFLMGPSGSGKTTLLDCLAGRTKRRPEGDIWFAGEPANPQQRSRLMRYCMQDPAFHEALTVDETLMVAARLCCASRNEAKRRVEWVLTSLGLVGCKDTKVGGMIFRGISGGQRKRLGIGEQVLAGAPVLFLDEPTSALDASAALQIAELVRLLAGKNGTTVVCSIHQPSNRVLSCASNVLLLATGGRQTYFGPPDSMQQHFESILGERITSGATAVEWVMEMVSLEVGGPDRIEISAKAWMLQPEVGGSKPILPSLARSEKTDARSGEPLPWLRPVRHTWVLFGRFMLNTLKNPLVVWVRMMMYMSLAIVIGTIWWGIGDGLKAGEVNNIGGVIFFVAALQSFMSVSSMPSFLEDKEVLVKERVGNSYSLISYNIAAFLASAPFVALIALSTSIILYWSLSLEWGDGKFFVYFANLTLTVLCAESLVFLIASIVPIFIVALAVCAFVMGSFMLVQGFYIRRPDIPLMWQWLHDIAFLSYSFRTAMYNEFEGRIVRKDLDITPPALEDFDGMLVLKNLDFDHEDIFENCLLLAAMIVFYRVAATFWQYIFHTGLK